MFCLKGIKTQLTKVDACFDDNLLNAKCFIYKCRLNQIKPNIEAFLNNYVKFMYKIDKYVHYRDMQAGKFYKKWCTLELSMNFITS